MRNRDLEKEIASRAEFDLLKAKGFEAYRELYRLVTVAQSYEMEFGDKERERQYTFAAVQKVRAKFVELLAPNGHAMTHSWLTDGSLWATCGLCCLQACTHVKR